MKQTGRIWPNMLRGMNSPLVLIVFVTAAEEAGWVNIAISLCPMRGIPVNRMENIYMFLFRID